MLSFQRLDVYRCAIELLAFAATLAERMPKGFASLAEQLRRASLSVPLLCGAPHNKGYAERVIMRSHVRNSAFGRPFWG